MLPMALTLAPTRNQDFPLYSPEFKIKNFFLPETISQPPFSTVLFRTPETVSFLVDSEGLLANMLEVVSTSNKRTTSVNIFFITILFELWILFGATGELAAHLVNGEERGSCIMIMWIPRFGYQTSTLQISHYPA